MSELQLTFPGCRFTVRGPENALACVSLLYHSAHLGMPASAEPPRLGGRFTVEEVDLGWQLRFDDEKPMGCYPEAVHALLAMEHAIEARLLGELADGVALHAGAVVVGGEATLLMGRADSGKSSTTFQMIELGHTFLAEEIAVVDADAQVRPHLQSIALDPRVVDELQRDRGLEYGHLVPIDELLYRYLPRRAAKASAPLSTIVLPAYRPGATARGTELGIEETLIELLGYCFEPRGRQEPFIERLIELFTGARLLRLSYPNAASARTVLADIFGRAGS